MARKLKPIDPSTRARFMREKRCFEPEHQKRINALAGELESQLKLNAALEEALSNLKAEKLNMITKGEADEMAIRVKLEGHREGAKEAEERLRKEKTCFDGFHKFFADKDAANLNICQMMRLFLHLAKSGISYGPDIRITAFVPKGYQTGGTSSQLETNKIVDEAIKAVFAKQQFMK